MARKRRVTKTAVKRTNRKKSDSDQNSNGVSDENELDSKQDSNPDDMKSSFETDSKQDSNTDDNQYLNYSFGEKSTTYKPKFRYFERRHSSSQEEDAEYNTSDLMPQQIQDIVLGDVKDVIISQDDIANDTCLQGNIEHEEVIEGTMECEVVECENMETSESDERTGVKESDSIDSVPLENCDLVKSFEKTVQINEDVSDIPKEEESDNACTNSSASEENIVKSDNINELVSTDICMVKSDSEISKNKEQEGEESIVKEDEGKKKNQTEEPRRRSNRIRVNRWSDNDTKMPAPQEVVSAPLPLPTSVFESEKPVKVKSRWRRTSELEMGSGTGSTTSDGEQTNTKSLSLTGNQELARVDPEVEERLKSFDIITHCVFLTPRVKSKDKNMYCDCTLSKEEMAKGEMGCGEDCLNRLLMIECGPRCSLGNHCSNKRFQNCQYTPCEVIKTKRKGLGLITTIDVDGGAFLMEYVGEVLGHKEFRRRAKEYAKEKNTHYYFMSLKGLVIDATVKGNISRFINHSCDPNSETQKWTVNGEVRIGFFSKRPIAAGEEITFDYKLERYGKEAQKCFCESPNCRGWIGENPENEKDREKKDSGSRKEKKEKKRKDEKRRDFLNDRELDDEIEKLVATGVKNQKHTLTLSRLMVRVEEESSRKQLLEIAQAADIRCQRLFLDYHGLSLLWSWMLDSRSSSDLRMKILSTLAKLPIANKTMLQDSKVLSVVQKWARAPREEDSTSDTKERNTDTDVAEDSSPNEEKADSREKNEKDEEMEKNIVAKANELLGVWGNLKQEFRIPKKERIEQMKVHEREADRGYGDPRENQSYDRHWNYEKENRNYEKENRYGNSNNNHRDRKRGRESPSESGIPDWRKSRMQDDRHSNNTNRLSKTERRQLFAMKVEEEERQRKMEDWAKQHAQMLGPPVPPGPPAQLDPNQGYYQQPPFHPASDGGEMVFGPPAFPPPFLGAPQSVPPYIEGPPPHYPTPPPNGPPPGGFNPPSPFTHPSIAPQYQPPLPPYPPPFPFNPPPQVYTPAPPIPTPSVPNPNLPVPAVSLSLPPPVVTMSSTAPSALPLPTVPPPGATALPTSVGVANVTPPLPQSFSTRVFPIKLPPKWKSAKDKEGRIYYYHSKTRKSQWQIPTEENAQQLSESDSDSEESSEEEEESSTEEEEEEKEEEDYEFPQFNEEEDESMKKDEDDDDTEYIPEEIKFEDIPISSLPPSSTPPVLKKRREGLVQVNIISPRDDEDDYRCGIKKKQIRETKERLAKEKKKLRNSAAAKCDADTTVGPRRRIKDLFRVQMANVVVALLNPYRKSDCKTARITNTEDFKHLARKLTHFVMVKELKHCASVEGLECNDNVKHKAKDFIRKYMSKFGPVYRRSPDDLRI